MAKLIGALLLLALAVPATAQVYRWVDENGKVHYSQVPPKDGKFEAARPPPKVSDSPNQDALNQSLNETVEGRDDTRAEADARAAELAAKQRRCDQARQQIAAIDNQPGQRFFKTDADGNQVRVSEAEISGRRAEIERSARENCS